MAKEYWYNKSSTANEIAKINEKYNAVVKAALAIGTLLQKNVCKAGLWNDANAEVFACWWNQNGKSGGAGGDLKWDSNDKKLVMSKSNTQSDGEDKIRHIVSMTGAAYYTTTCKTLAALESAYSDEMKSKYATYLTVAADSKYINLAQKQDYSGKTWPTLMSKYFGLKAWSDTTLDTTRKEGSSTSVPKVVTMASDLASLLKTLNTKVDNFNAEITKVATNTNTSKYWGFSTDLTADTIKIARNLSNKTTKWLKSFSDNTSLALSTVNNMVDKDLATLSNIKFS